MRLEIVLYFSLAIPLLALVLAASRGGVLWRDVDTDAVADPGRRYLLRVPHQMSVARGRFHLRVSQQPADHGQALA